MTKTRKKGGMVSPSTREGHHAVHAAPDNPPSIPRGPSPTTLEAPRRIPGETIELWRSSWIHMTKSMTLDTGNEPVPSLTNRELANRRNRESDHDWRSAQNDNSRLHDSALTPLEEVGGLQSTIWSPDRRPRPESSLAGEDLLGSDLGEWRQRELHHLERDARIMNERLQQARNELEDECSHSPWNSKSTSSPEAENENHRHHSVSDENIQQAMHNLRTPTHREGEMRDEYNTCLEWAEKYNAAWKKLCQQEQLRIEAESLLLEIKEAERKHHHKTGR